MKGLFILTILFLTATIISATSDPFADCRPMADPGTCKGAMSMFAYDMKDNMCKPFNYGGCGGNANRFETMAACQAKCARKM